MRDRHGKGLRQLRSENNQQKTDMIAKVEIGVILIRRYLLAGGPGGPQ